MSSEAGENFYKNFGKYQFICKLAEGGMGIIYKAFDPELNRFVAIKILKIQERDFVKRFIREAKIQASLDHPCICKVFEAGEINGQTYIAMQLIRGRSLEELIRELSPETKVKIIKEIAEALHEAHKTGLIHRDIKPGNIMVEFTEEGKFLPYIVDFGLARHREITDKTITRMIIGTPAYMAPEQAKGQIHLLDRRTDVYGLGASLYTILTGKPPFQGSTLEIIKKVVEEDPIPPRKLSPEISKDLETIILKCLEKDPNRRYESAKALAEDLERFLNGEPIKARKPSVFYKFSKLIKKNRTAASFLLFGLVFSLFFGLMAIKTRLQQRKITSLAREYDLEVKYIENFLWYTYTKPLHDVRGELTLIKDRIKLFEKLIEKEAPVSKGPGYYALGRVYMILNDYKTAYKYLKSAWNDYKYKVPEVNYALGITLAMIYQEELEKTKLVENIKLRDRKIQSLKKKYLQKSIQLINSGSSRGMQPWKFGEGILALLEGKYSEAAKKFNSTFEKFPWLYEAKKLEGDAYVLKAEELQKQGFPKKALSLYEKAIEVYTYLSQQSESFPAVYQSLCNVETRIVELFTQSLKPSPRTHFEKAVSFCKKALTANPEDIISYGLITNAYIKWGMNLIFRGKSPLKTLNEALFYTKRGLSLKPNDPLLRTKRGDIFLIMASYERASGKEPVHHLNQAIENYRKVLATNPFNSESLDGLAGAYWNKGSYLASVGRNPLPSFKAAISTIEKLLKIEKGFTSAYNSLGNIYLDKSLYENLSQKNPLPSIESSIFFYKKALQLNPSSALYMSNLGLALYLKANYLFTMNRLKEKDILTEAEKLLTEAKKLIPAIVWTYVSMAQINILKARIKMRNSDNPESNFSEAIKCLKECLSLSGEYPEVYEMLLQVYKWKAIWEISKGYYKKAKETISTGLKLADNVLRKRAGTAGIIAIKGIFYHLRAKISKNSPGFS